MLGDSVFLPGIGCKTKGFHVSIIALIVKQILKMSGIYSLDMARQVWESDLFAANNT